MTEPLTDQRFAPTALWRVASRLMVTLFNLFGEPEKLAFQHTLIARDYKLACDWLRTVEALFRKLLFIEASHYAREVSETKPRIGNKRMRREMTFYPENPDAWRVTFRTSDGVCPRPHGSIDAQSPASDRLGAAGEDARAPSTTPYLAPTTFHSAWPLAERFEALLRVHNNPAPYAKRLARRTYAHPPQLAALIKAPETLHRRINPEPHAEIDALIEQRYAAAFPNTT